MTFFIAAILFLLVSAATAPLSRLGSAFWDRLSLGFGFAGTLCGLGATILCLANPPTASLSLPWLSFGGSFFLRLDPLSGIFLLPAFVISGAGLLYGTDYWPAAKNPGTSAWIRTFYPLFVCGIGLLLTAGNGLLFLIGWELMALSGYFLVITEREKEEAQQAGFLYLAATHTGTLALLGMFALLGEPACLVSLPASGTIPATTATADAVFLLALFGFGCKAGIVPLHIWLPRAHAAAPSHVSAMMSGVTIKTGIYGLLRITSLFTAVPAWWGWLVLTLGLISGLLGVLFAICQHDIKRLLAYHSVENIGIILIGSGIALLGSSYNMPAVTVLGMAGALLHVINHGLFKGLLFLSAGSMIHATGTRQMAAYGGLLKAMPLTGLFFLGGAVAICGLPPMNGFISEWFIYLGLLRGGVSPSNAMAGCLLAVAGLAVIGGLALLCFAKVFGLSFLGMPRGEYNHLHDAPRSMQAAMLILLAACLWIGLLPGTMQPFLDAGVGNWSGVRPAAGLTLSVLAPAGYLSLGSLLLISLLCLFLRLGHYRKTSEIPRQPTWGCGYNFLLPRGQYTTSSFAEMIVKLFRWTLLAQFDEKKPARLFPATATFHSSVPDLVLDRVIIPGCSFMVSLAISIRKKVQHGNIGIYILYTATTLCLFLYLVIF